VDPQAALGGRFVSQATIALDMKKSHSDSTLYISLEILHTKYTGRRQSDFNIHA
jgi:hypothetical protein